MIIINLWAILVIAIVVCIGIGLNAVAPTLFAGPYNHLAVGILVAIAGSISELMGIRGRIFFIPLWIIGFGTMAYQAYALWGVAGVIMPVAAIGTGIWWMVRTAIRREGKRWEMAAVSLNQLKAMGEGGEAQEFWKLVSSTVVFPMTGSYSPLACAHNLEVTKVVRQKAVGLLDAREAADWQSFETFLKDNEKRAKSQLIDFDLQKRLEDSLEARAKAEVRSPNKSVQPQVC